tara:strand:- start:727 stop:909 length:183 start_codon:yes stop_codon:yes gene_type:complete
MKWFRNLFGILNSLERKKRKLELIQKKAFEAQRNGNLTLAGKYFLEAEVLETEIVEEMEK